jgi:L-2-hydroxycarboxylate dehydrogenase (NAD+)
LDTIARSAAVPGVDAVRWPGQLRASRLRQARQQGVPLDPRTHEELQRLALSCGVKPLAAFN